MEDGVYYRADLPLSWEALDDFDPYRMERWLHADTTLFRALATLDTPLPESEREGCGAAGKWMEHLEAKLDLTLTLLTQLLSQHLDLPPARTVTLRAERIEWVDGAPPPLDTKVLVTLYLSPNLPQPCLLPAVVRSVRPAEGGQRISATFAPLGEEVEDWLERTLFRYHRRSIQRSHQRTGNN